MVRAKFKCYEIAEYTGWDSNKDNGKGGKGDYCKAMKFKFQIVSGGSPENEHFYAVSGGSNLELQTINPEVFEQFKVGAEYYADISYSN